MTQPVPAKGMVHALDATELQHVRVWVEHAIAAGGYRTCTLESALTMADLLATIDSLTTSKGTGNE